MSQAGDHGVTRRASSATSSVPKVSRKLLLQNGFLQPVPAMNDNSSVMASLQDKAVAICTVSCQPAEDQDALYISISCSSL